jgi:hypothetical protein
MNIFKNKASRIIAIAVVLCVFVAAPLLPSTAPEVHAAGAPWVKFNLSKDLSLSQGEFAEITFKSENVTATSAKISITSSSKAVKVYEVTVTPGSKTGFTGNVIVRGITAGKSSDLKLSVVGDESIKGDVISANVSDSISSFYIKSKLAASPKRYIYLKRGKSISLKAYATAKGSTTYGSYNAFCNDYSVPAKSVKWKTSNKKIASVGKTGKVKVNKKASYGKYATITATYKGKSVKYRVYVLKKTGKVEKLEYSGDRIKTMPVRGAWLLEYKSTLSKSGTNASVKWASNDKKIATVNACGLVTAKKVGIVQITAKAGDSILTYTVNVLSMPDYIEWAEEEWEDDDDWD